MAKKSRKSKITGDIITLTQESPIPPEAKEEKKPAEGGEKKKKQSPKKEKSKKKPQISPLHDTPKTTPTDSETAGINFGISGVL